MNELQKYDNVRKLSWLCWPAFYRGQIPQKFSGESQEWDFVRFGFMMCQPRHWGHKLHFTFKFQLFWAAEKTKGN